MKKLLRSFAAGVGSILSVYPQHKADARVCAVEAIGGDFTKVGGDISRAIQAKADSITAPKDTISHGEAKEEQLDLILN